MVSSLCTISRTDIFREYVSPCISLQYSRECPKDVQRKTVLFKQLLLPAHLLNAFFYYFKPYMFFDLIFLLRRIKACAVVLHDDQMEIILPDC